MKVTLYRQLHLRNNEVQELWTVNPKKQYLCDENRSVKWFLVLLSHKYSVEHVYKLKRSTYGDYTYEKYYEYDNTVPPPPPGLTVSFDYTPYVGKRSCKKCNHYVRLKRGGGCEGRLKLLRYSVWENCNYWSENSVLRNLCVTQVP